MRNPQLQEFLKESNAIEGVYDSDSLHQANLAWQYLMQSKVLTVDVVLKTHKILMLHHPLQPDEKGFFRRCEVRIGHGFGTNYMQVPAMILDWCSTTMACASIPITPIDLHIAYERIHPFVDGNGRTGRMFLNWTRIKLTEEPLLVIKKSEVAEYYSWFR